MSQIAIGLPPLVRWHRAAADPRSAAAAFGFATVVLLGFADGGFYASTWRWALIALGAVAGIQLVLRRAPAPTRFGLLSLASLSALAGWMLLSAVWGIEGTEALRETERCAVYVVALAALLATVTSSSTRALLLGVLTGCVALATVALGDRLLAEPQLDPYQGSLLKEPIGYANALGVLMAIGVVLALGLRQETAGRSQRRVLAAAAAISAVALMLTSSRGAWLATLAGLGVLALWRWHSPRAIAAVAGVAILLSLLALPRMSFGDRPAYWSVATSSMAEHPVLGSGAGSFDDVWLEERPIPAYVRDAHSLYLETTAELGIVGLALLLCALGTPLVAVARAADRRLAAPAAAGYAAFLVHAGLDWDWEMPVTTLAGLACGAALTARGRSLHDTPPSVNRPGDRAPALRERATRRDQIEATSSACVEAVSTERRETSKARILALVGVTSALGILPAASALASEVPSSNLKISITVTNLATGQPLSSRETVAAGTPLEVTVRANDIDCAGQFVVSALGAPGSPPSVLVQFVQFVIDGADVTGSPLTAGALPSGGNDFKVSASCNGAEPKSFSHDDFEFYVGA